MFRLHISGYGANRIAKLLSDTLGENFPTYTINNILNKAQKYAGHYQSDKYGDYNGVYPAIITDDVAQKSTEIRMQHTYKRTKEFQMLRRKVTCGICGRRLAFQRTNNHEYYYCRSNSSHKISGTVNMPAQRLTEAVSQSFVSLLENPSVKAALTSRFTDEQLTMKQRKQRLKQANTQAENALFTLFEDKKLTVDEFKERLAKLKIQQSASKQTPSVGLKNVLERFNTDILFQRRVLNKMIDQITVRDEGVNQKILTGVFIKNHLNILRKEKRI